MDRIVMVALALLAVPTLAGLARADEKPAPVQGLEFTVLTSKESYPLNASGVSAKELAEKLDEIEKSGVGRRTPPNAPKVAFTLVVSNTTAKEQTIYIDGDTTLLTLELQGPGVRKLEYRVSSSKEIRGNKPVVIKPGQSFSREVSELEWGPRGQGHRLYWTKPGEYTLTAKWQLGGPREGKETGPTITSAPVKFKVAE